MRKKDVVRKIIGVIVALRINDLTLDGQKGMRSIGYDG